MNARTILPALALPLCLLMTSAAEEQPANEEPIKTFSKGVVIPVEGVILPQLERFVLRKLDEARQMKADLVVFEINSPGGALDSTMNLAKRLRDMQWARSVAFIPDEALSGAAIIALACDDIVMAPQARLGDAGPVFQGPDALFRHAPEKIRSDLSRRVRDLAAAKGRPPALAEAMVNFNLVVYRVIDEDTGKISFMSQAEIDSSDNPQRWTKDRPVLESREGAFLEVNGTRAVELQLADGTVTDLSELEQRYQVNEPLQVLKRGAVDHAVEILNNPLATGLLFVVGAIALYVELSAPGIGVGGLVSGLCFSLFFWSRFLGGTAGWLEVILVLSGVAFLAVELFIIPGFGIAGIAGILLMLAGVVLAGQNHWIPQSSRGLSSLGSSLLVVIGSGGVTAVAALALSYYYGSIPILNRLVLRSPGSETNVKVDEKGQSLPPVRRFAADVGDWGVAQSPLRPAGKAVFGDEYLDVVTDGSFVDAGGQVRIIEISGNRIVVREIEPDA